MKRASFCAAAMWLAGALPGAAAPAVLQVGTYNGITGAYTSVSAAVLAAHPGDWILIGPGDYHENGNRRAGVWITTPNLHIRGMDRNAVVIDGTKLGAPQCSGKVADQGYVLKGGRNGIEVWKTDGVSIENLTVCNYLSDHSGSGGNQIWWNGGDGSGVIGMGSYWGAYLSATSTFRRRGGAYVGQYGIFVSNSRGPGVIERSYASNMADSSFYIGACQNCRAVLTEVHAENSALGYSGTNSGGQFVISNSEWNNNRVGIVPSSLATDDLPSPQNGACPRDPGKSCMIITGNYVHDNNNPNTPNSLTGLGPPTGTGIEITGGRNDTVEGNLIANNGAWGMLINDYPDFSTSSSSQYCTGGLKNYSVPPPFNQLLGNTVPCYFPAFGSHVLKNRFVNNGGFGNVTNGDLANLQLPYSLDNCWRGNTDLSGAITSAPANLQSPSVGGTCDVDWNPVISQVFTLTAQVLCDAFGPSLGTCNGATYPQTTGIRLIALQKQPTMPDPCAGVPANSWCTGTNRRR